MGVREGSVGKAGVWQMPVELVVLPEEWVGSHAPSGSTSESPPPLQHGGFIPSLTVYI